MIANMNFRLIPDRPSMRGGHPHRLLLAAGLMVLHMSCAFAQPAAEATASVSDIVGRYPAGSIQSVEMADAALADTGRARAGIEVRFSAEERACYSKFFAASCVEQAKDRRREALMQLRKVELEANSFQRKERVQERDRALAERQAKAQADSQERAEIPVKSKDVEGPALERKPAIQLDEQPVLQAERSARHEAKMNRVQAEESKDAKKRAENAAAYEKKVQAAQERQKKVAERKAKKEEMRRKKQRSQSTVF